MTLVTSVTYNYKVNGFTISTIKPQRGLRQGNPLSPFLFILVADVLSLMINKAVDLEEFDGFKLAGEAPTFTHLMFADDALLFTKTTPRDVFNMMNILNIYSRNLGQRINISES